MEKILSKLQKIASLMEQIDSSSESNYNQEACLVRVYVKLLENCFQNNNMEEKTAACTSKANEKEKVYKETIGFLNQSEASPAKRFRFSKDEDEQLINAVVNFNAEVCTPKHENWCKIKKRIFPDNHTTLSLYDRYYKYLLPLVHKKLPNERKKVFLAKHKDALKVIESKQKQLF